MGLNSHSSSVGSFHSYGSLQDTCQQPASADFKTRILPQVQRQLQKHVSPCANSCSHRVWHASRPHAANHIPADSAHCP